MPLEVAVLYFTTQMYGCRVPYSLKLEYGEILCAKIPQVNFPRGLQLTETLMSVKAVQAFVQLVLS